MIIDEGQSMFDVCSGQGPTLRILFVFRADAMTMAPLSVSLTPPSSRRLRHSISIGLVGSGVEGSWRSCSWACRESTSRPRAAARGRATRQLRRVLLERSIWRMAGASGWESVESTSLTHSLPRLLPG